MRLARRSLLLLVLVGAVLALASCGDDGAVENTIDPTTDPTPDAPAPTGEVDGVDGVGPVGATVTIGDTVYELPEEDNCFSTELGGMTSAFSDGSGVDADFNLPPLDWETSSEPWEPPGVGLRDTSGEGRQNFVSSVRLADSYPGTAAEQAVVAAYEFGVGWASGSGLMIDTQALVQADQDGTAPPEPVPFSFRVVCEP